jgi:hypothetical protein
MLFLDGNSFLKAFAVTYNLDTITITVPQGFNIYPAKDINGSTGFNINNQFGKFIGSVFQTPNYDINPTIFQRYIHDLNKVLSDLSVIYYACNDGTLYISNNYCIVSYSYNDKGSDIAAIDFFTQLPDMNLLHWIFTTSTKAFNIEIYTYFDIVNSMTINSDNLDDGSNNGSGDNSGYGGNANENNGNTVTGITEGIT